MPHSVPAGPPLRPGERRSTSWAGFSGGRTRGPARPCSGGWGAVPPSADVHGRVDDRTFPHARRTRRAPRRASDSCPAGGSRPSRGAAERSSSPCGRHGRRAGTRRDSDRRPSPPARRSPGSSASPGPARSPNRCSSAYSVPSLSACLAGPEAEPKRRRRAQTTRTAVRQRERAPAKPPASPSDAAHVRRFREPEDLLDARIIELVRALRVLSPPRLHGAPVERR